MNKTVLILDDDFDFRRQLALSLKKRSYNCLQAESYASLQDVLQEYDFTHAIIDLKIEENHSGIDCLKLIKEKKPDVECVMLSGFGTISKTVEAVNAGASNFLTKPVSINEILNALSLQADHTAKDDFPSLSQVEWEHINNVLDQFSGNISQAAKALKMHRRTLQRKLLKPPRIN